MNSLSIERPCHKKTKSPGEPGRTRSRFPSGQSEKVTYDRSTACSMVSLTLNFLHCDRYEFTVRNTESNKRVFTGLAQRADSPRILRQFRRDKRRRERYGGRSGTLIMSRRAPKPFQTEANVYDVPGTNHMRHTPRSLPCHKTVAVMTMAAELGRSIHMFGKHSRTTGMEAPPAGRLGKAGIRRQHMVTGPPEVTGSR